MSKVPPASPAPEALVSLTYVGPPEQTSPSLGTLVVGRRYQMASALAEYLGHSHPDYWQAPPAVPKE